MSEDARKLTLAEITRVAIRPYVYSPKPDIALLERLMSEHEAACQQEAHFSPTDPQLQRLMSQAERDMQAAWQQAFAPRVPDVTGEGCADLSAPGAVGDIYIRSSSDVAVTQEMIAAGVQELLVAQGCVISESYWAEKIYRAMAALAPKDMFDASARDHAEAWANECMAKVAALEAERDTASAVLETTRLCIEALHDATAAKDTEIDTLKAQLAAFTAADPQPAVPDPPIRRPDGTPAPQQKPWGPPKHGGDPRRIGG